MSRRIKSVPVADRGQLKIKVDKIGRPLVAASLDMPYGSLANKLTGILPLSQSDYDRILSACEKIGGQQ